MNRIFTKLVLALVILPSFGYSAGMIGTYTIDPSGSGNYKTFTAAVSDLQVNGVSGPCVFKVANGMYNEQIRINSIKGASATNTITFLSDANDSTKVTLSWSTGISKNYTVLLDSADYIHFKKMTIQRTGMLNNYGIVVYFRKNACFNSIENCRLLGSNSGTAQTYTSVIYSDTTNDSNNVIKNNLIRFGYAGIYMTGASSSSEANNLIEGNTVDSFLTYGIWAKYQAALTIRFNTVSTGVIYYQQVGIYSMYCAGGYQNNANKVFSTYLGIYTAYCNGNSVNPVIVSNNMVTLYKFGSTDVYGLFNVLNTNIYVVYNSILMEGSTQSYSYGLHFYPSNSKSSKSYLLNNNIIQNYTTGTSYALYVPVNGTYITNCNFNNYTVKKGAYTAFWNQTICTDLKALKTANGMDSNSVSINPVYLSKTNLHIINSAMHSTGTPVSFMKYDYDGQLRDSLFPDIGADEIFPDTLDAGILSLDSPFTGSCAGKNTLALTIYNAGTDTLTSAEINWTINDSFQPAFHWADTLAPAEISKPFAIGNYVLNRGEKYNLKAWITKPDSGTDGNHSNDTLNSSIITAMSGTYTIGGTNPDFPTFSAALNSLYWLGVCDDVIFNIRDGVYQEKNTIYPIKGSSATSTITFQSESLDSTKVEYWCITNTVSSNSVFFLNGCDYIIFNKISVRCVDTGVWKVVTYGHPFSLWNGADHITIQNCKIYTNATWGNSIYCVGSTAGVNNQYFSVINNLIRSHYNGIYVYSNSSNQSNLLIKDNRIDSFGYNACYLWGQDKFIASGNNLNTKGNGSLTGFGVYYCHSGYIICNNKVDIRSNTTNTCIDAFRSYCTVAAPALVYNNFFSTDGTGVYTNECEYINFYHNNFNISGTGLDLVSAVNSYPQNVFNNNIITRGGPAISDNGPLGFSDYNNIKVTSVSGKLFIYHNGNAYSDLASWQKVGYDLHSVSIDPGYLSTSNLHVNKTKIPLDGGAKRFKGFDRDIDGELRDTIKPDIGADEFSPWENDLASSAILNIPSTMCGDSNITIKAVYMNMGSDTQKNVKFYAKLTGMIDTTLVDSIASLAYKATDTFTFKKKIDIKSGGVLNIKTYALLVNDSNRINDTAYFTSTITKVGSHVKVSNQNLCSFGNAMMIAGHDPGEVVYWYSKKGIAPYYKGDTLNTGYITKDVTYYVETVRPAPALYCPGILDSVTVFVNTNGGQIVPDTSNYSGLIKKGTSSSPDQVCSSDGIGAYQIQSSYKNSEYDSVWTISKWSMKTNGGTDAKNVSVTKPSAAGIGKFLFKPSASESDSFFILSVTIHDILKGCDSTMTRYIYVAPSPTAKFTSTTNCQGYSTIFTDSSSAGKGKLFYSYDFGDGSTSNLASTSHTYAKAGTYKVVLTVKNSAGCTSQFVDSVIVYPKPTAIFGALDGCTNNPIQFTDSSLANGGTINSWFYDFGDGDTSTSANPIHNYASLGTYTVKLVVISMDGCKDSFTKDITVYTSPKASFKTGLPCAGRPQNFINTTPGGPSLNYLWEFGDGDTSSSINPIHTYPSPGKYVVKLTAVNPNGGCKNSKTDTIIVTATPNAVIVADSIGCTNTPVTFQDKGSNSTTWLWKFGDGQTSTLQSPSYAYTSKGSYTITLIASNANNCSDTATQNITVNESPIANFGFDSACINSPVQFYDSSTIGSGTISWSWDFGDTTSGSTSQNPTHTFKNSGKYKVKLTTTSGGCSNTIVKSLKVNSLPVISFSKSSIKKTATFTPSDLTLTSYEWDFGDGDTSTDLIPTHAYATDNIYSVKLTVINSIGCEASFTDTLNIKTTGMEESQLLKYMVNVAPNPFYRSTKISYFLPKSVSVSIEVTDALGRIISGHLMEQQPQGIHEYIFEPELADGVYYIRIKIGEDVMVKKVVGLNGLN